MRKSMYKFFFYQMAVFVMYEFLPGDRFAIFYQGLNIVLNSFPKFVWLVRTESVLSFLKGKKVINCILVNSARQYVRGGPSKLFSGKGSGDGLPVTFNVCKGIFKLFFLFYKLFTELSSSKIQFLGMADRVHLSTLVRNK